VSSVINAYTALEPHRRG